MLEKVRLGRTGLEVTRVAMGCIPIQRLSHDDAVALLRKAYDQGVNFFDTAHVYTNSEERVGAAFADGLRQNVVIATKAMAKTYETTMKQLETSLQRLRTDYIDIYQWHNPESLDDFQNSGPYQAMLDAKKAGKIRFIGITNHNLGRAHIAIESGAFDTLQFPISVLSSRTEIDMTFLCAERDIGFIAMKAMCGGLLNDGRLPFAFLRRYPHIVPIWGMEKQTELQQFIDLAANPPPYDEGMEAEVEALRRELGDRFCRGCGYCLPCPANIDLPIYMRVTFFISRNPEGSQFTEKRLADVANIDNCVQCGACAERCPYKLDVPAMIKEQQKDYYRLYEAYKASRA